MNRREFIESMQLLGVLTASWVVVFGILFIVYDSFF